MTQPQDPTSDPQAGLPVHLHSISKSFGSVQAVSNVNLDVPAGSFSALLGPSGCGKTTLLRLIAGFDSPDRGSISLGDRLVVDGDTFVPPERRGVGIVPQEGALFPHLSVAENVGFGLPREERDGTRVREMLQLVGLADLAKRRPHELSGGQQQRVALARCLATRPSVVLLDEPFAALDATLRTELRSETKRVLRESGATTILVTHDQDEALSMADRVALIRNGTVAQYASPAVLYSDPVDAWTAAFVGEANLLPVMTSGEGFNTLFGPLAVRADRRTDAGAKSFALIRPEQLSFGGDGVGVDAIVSELTFHGHDYLVSADTVIDSSKFTLVVRAPAWFSSSIGDRVNISMNGNAVLVNDL